MNKEEIIKNFNIKKEKNKKLMNILNEKIRMSRIRQLDFKIVLLLAFSSIPMLVFNLALMIASAGGLIISNLSAFSVAALLIGTTFGTGAIINKIINKKFQIKERIKKFSKAKIEQEKLEEEIRYQIEYEKLNSKNNLIDKTITDLETNSKILNKVSNNYYLINKDESKSKEMLENDINNINDKIKRQKIELDELTTKKVLCDILSCTMQKYMLVSFVIATFTSISMYLGLSLYLAAKITNTVITDLFLLPIGSISLIGSLITGSIMSKKNHNLKIIFNKIKNELGDTTLTVDLSELSKKLYSETDKIISLINSKIEDISSSQLLLLEKKQTLESLSSNDGVKEEKTNSQNLSLQKPAVQEELNESLIGEPAGPKLVKIIKPLR